MNCLNIKVGIDPGSTIYEACKDAVGLANQLNSCIEFTFNDVHCMAVPNGDPDRLAASYHKEGAKKSGYRIATCNK